MPKNIETPCVDRGTTRCVRCKGRKKLFKLNSIYSYTNTGGIEVQCPMCLGNGYNKPIGEALSEIKTFYSKDKKNKKDFKDEQPKEETAK